MKYYRTDVTKNVLSHFTLPSPAPLGASMSIANNYEYIGSAGGSCFTPQCHLRNKLTIDLRVRIGHVIEGFCVALSI
jgi:hypothetical protein